MTKRITTTRAAFRLGVVDSGPPVNLMPVPDVCYELRDGGAEGSASVTVVRRPAARPGPAPDSWNPIFLSGEYDGAGWTPADVAARIEAAMSTLRRLPKQGPQGFKSSMPDVLRGQGEIWALAVAKGGYDETRVRLGPPPGRDIDLMVEALWWLMWVPVDHRRLVMAHALTGGRPDWPVLAHRFGKDKSTLRRWHRAALDAIAERLNRDRVKKPVDP